MGSSPASRTADGGAGIRTENSLTGEAVPEPLGGRDKESVTFGHVNDSRSREFEGKGETQDSGCFSPYTLNLHVIKHPPDCEPVPGYKQQRPVRNHGCTGAYLAQTPSGCTTGLPMCSRGSKHSRHTEAHPGSSHTHGDNPDTRRLHARNTA